VVSRLSRESKLTLQKVASLSQSELGFYQVFKRTQERREEIESQASEGIQEAPWDSGLCLSLFGLTNSMSLGFLPQGW
jgi:hypothetical protein